MKRKPHTPQEKAALVLETFWGEKTINEIASANEIHPNMLSRWKRKAEVNLFFLFENDSTKKLKEQKEQEDRLQELYAQIGKLTTQVEWLKKNLVCEFPASQRQALINKDHPELSISEQARHQKTTLYILIY